MLVVWMAYAVGVSALLLVGAFFVEPTVRKQRRALWAAALGSAVAVPFLLPLLERVLTAAPGPVVVLGPIQPILDAPLSALRASVPRDAAPDLATRATVAWALMSVGLWVALAAGVVRVRRWRKRWSRTEVDGISVLVSPGVGPAVVGLWRPEIVVPAWVLELPPHQRSLILSHEEEHRRGRDPMLLAAALGVLAAFPWNLPLWWGFRRLREAIETDCDARVLDASGAAVGPYADLLLRVGSRSTVPVPVAAGFGEQTTSLERRIRAMLGSNRERGWRSIAARVSLAALLVVAACSLEVNINTGESVEDAVDAPVPDAPDAVEIPVPTPPVAPPSERADAEPDQEAPPPPPPPQESEVDLSAGPTFTPFTEAPSILNREEIVAAMESEFPPLLREAGVGGTVRVYFFINADGAVEKAIIDRSSGHAALDQAAMRVAELYRFTPARNKGENVPVWVSFPITFQVR